MGGLEDYVEACCERAMQMRIGIVNLEGGENEVGAVWKIGMCSVSERLTG